MTDFNEDLFEILYKELKHLEGACWKRCARASECDEKRRTIDGKYEVRYCISMIRAAIVGIKESDFEVPFREKDE
jgi:hypothetical protein